MHHANKLFPVEKYIYLFNTELIRTESSFSRSQSTNFDSFDFFIQ